MAEGVEPETWIDDRLVTEGENDSGSSDCGRDNSGLHDSVAHRSSRLVPAAADHRRSLFQPGEICSLGGYTPADFGGLVGGGHPSSRNPAAVQHYFRPDALPDVEQ